MTFFTEYVKNDEEFSADPTMKTTVISNLRFVVEAIMNCCRSRIRCVEIS